MNDLIPRKNRGLILCLVALGAAWYFPQWIPAIAIAFLVLYLASDSIVEKADEPAK